MNLRNSQTNQNITINNILTHDIVRCINYINIFDIKGFENYYKQIYCVICSTCILIFFAFTTTFQMVIISAVTVFIFQRSFSLILLMIIF